MSSNTKTLTEGPLAKQILLVSLPLAFSNLLQVLFNMSGVAVVGRFAGSFIVLHNRVLSALRHLYSCDFRDTSFLIRFRTHSRLERAFVLLSEENKKSEPFSYREKVRIFIVWCE